MGTDINDSVLDTRLRVHGTEGLRVADTSVLTREPDNTIAPTIAVEAKAATMILEDR